MAFTEKFLPVSKHRYFTFFATAGDIASDDDLTLDEQFSASWPFTLDKIRIHLNATHVSVVSFVVTLSHHIDSAYNEILVSQAMFGVKDVLFQAEPNRLFHYNDTFSIQMAMSAANAYGLEVSGWQITG